MRVSPSPMKRTINGTKLFCLTPCAIRQKKISRHQTSPFNYRPLCISQIEASTSPPPGIPRAFDVFSCPAAGNLINLVFPGAGIWSLLIGSDKSCRRQAFMHSKWKIPDSWRSSWKAKACTSFLLYLKVFKNHLYYLWHVRVLSIKPCLHTQLPEHNKSYLKVSRAFDHLEWTYDGAFEQLFGLGRPGGCPGGGMLKLRFDWYIRLRRKLF